MAKNRLLKNISANTLQLITNQVFGLAIFYALSKGLDKAIFGEINWALAVLLTAFAILSFGIDQLMVKKIASGDMQIFSLYSFHVLIAGFLFYALMLLCSFFIPNPSVILFIGIGKLMIFFSGPFKQLATGREKFEELFFMSVVSNVIRGAALLVLLLSHQLTLQNSLLVFILADLAELVLCRMIAARIPGGLYKLKWDKKLQLALLKESAPQAGVVIFTALMSRSDWILIGIIVSSAKLAEYSFAWKIFELSMLPLLVTAPLILPLFSRVYKNAHEQTDTSFFLQWQIVIASLSAMILNLCWAPVIDSLTDGNYGAINSGTVFLLSLSLPVIYFNNYLWTINFAKGKLRYIFGVMGASFAVNIIACLILIPIYQNEGAAFANLLGVLTQLAFYLRSTSFSMSAGRKYFLLLPPLAALLCGYLAIQLNTPLPAAIAIAIALYASLIFVGGQLRISDWRLMKSLYH